MDSNPPRGRRRGRTNASEHRTDAVIEAQRIAATLGTEARSARRRRRRSQASVAADVGISRSRYAELERGEGAKAPLDLWIRIGLVLDRPVAVSMSREIGPALPADAGHLAGQEWILERARTHGRDARFELRTGAAPGAPVVDVVLRDESTRTLGCVEFWNRLDDLGAATRASDRKLADAQTLGLLAGGDRQPYRVVLCWLMVDSEANRRLVTTYPSILRTRFPGSSTQLARALRDGRPFPDESAIAWFDPRVGDVRPMRLA